MHDTKKLKDKIEIAKKAVDGLEEPFKTESFKVILNKLLDSPDILSSNQTEKQNQIKELSETKLEINIDEYHYISKLNAGRDQSLALLQWGLNEHPNRGLTPQEISKMLIEKFRIAYTPNTINVSLGRVTGNYVSRVREGKTYRYQITKKGQDYLENVIKKIEKVDQHGS